MGGREDKTNVDPFLSPGKFYIQSIIQKKTGAKSTKKVKSVFRYSKDIEIARGYEIQKLSKKCLSMRCLWNRPTVPGQVSHFDRTGGQIRAPPSNRSTNLHLGAPLAWRLWLDWSKSLVSHNWISFIKEFGNLGKRTLSQSKWGHPVKKWSIIFALR